MTSKIIFPNEDTMKVEDLEKIKTNLNKFYHSKKIKEKGEIKKLNLCFGELQGYILIADRKKLTDYFTYFYKLNFLDIFNQFLELKIDNITFGILEMINFFTSNIQSEELLQHLYSKKYPAYIPDFQGVQMNIIDKLVSTKLLNNDEFITYQINFMKSLILKINKDSINYFYNSDINLFPILTKALSLYNHSDPLIKNVVKNIFLTLIKLENKKLRDFLISFPINLYYSNVIFEFKNTIINLCFIDFGHLNNQKNYYIMRKNHDFLFDTCLYLSDLLLLNIENINYILINCLLNEIILPIIYSIIQYKNQEYITIYHSLYILSLILYTIKNELIYKVITFFLFREEIPKPLYEKIIKTKFSKIDEKIMNNINILITKSLDADVNSPIWKEISSMMKNTNGKDLSSGELDPENIYDYINNLMNSNNENIKNPIFDNIKYFYLCYDDAIILNLNLIIYSCIQYYNSNEEEDNNKISEKDNLLNNKFFEINLNDNKSENIFNHLLNYLNSSKNFRVATNEIIIYNIQLFIKIFLKKNNNNQEYKKIIGKKLLNIMEKQISNLNKLIENDTNSIKYLLDSRNKAYEYYVKNMAKKINDLISLSNILVPMIYLDEFEEIPVFLKEDKYNYDYLKNYLIKIFFINDIINEIFENKNNIIKNNKKCLNEADTIKLLIGKEYKLEDLGDECYHCKVFKNNKYINSECIFSADTLYFGEIMSGDFEDLSKIKIFKKIPLRYLEVKKTEDNCLLDIFDKTNQNTYKNVTKINCLNVDNTKVMFNFFIQKIFNCQLLEQTLFNNFIDKIKNNINEIILE